MYCVNLRTFIKPFCHRSPAHNVRTTCSKNDTVEEVALRGLQKAVRTGQRQDFKEIPYGTVSKLGKENPKTAMMPGEETAYLKELEDRHAAYQE